MYPINKQNELVIRLATPEDVAWFGASQELGADRYREPSTQNEIAPDHISPQTGIGLGREAVSAAFNDMETYGPFLYKSQGKQMVCDSQDVNFQRRAHKSAAREKLHRLSTAKKHMFEVLITQYQMPQWLNELVGLNEADIQDPSVDKATPLISKLTQKDAEGKYTVGDRTFQNFLEWHNFCLAQEQKAFDTQKETYIGIFKAAVQQGIAAGWMPKTALERLDRLDAAIMAVDDGFSTVIEGRNGYTGFRYDDKEVVIFGPNRMHNEKTFTHECVHVIHGRQRTESEGSYGGLMLGTLFDEKEFPSGTIVEACVEHIAGALRGDDIDDLMSVKHKHAYSYPEERKLLWALCETGVEKVDVRLFINALIEEPNTLYELGQESANAKLAAQLKAAFPNRDILHEVTLLKNGQDIHTLGRNLRVEALRRNNFAAKILIGYVRIIEGVTRSGYRHKVARKQKKAVSSPDEQ